MKKTFSRLKMTPALRTRLKAALSEDIGPGDTTTELLVPPHVTGKAVILARENGVLCGTEILQELFRLVDRGMKLRFSIKEGGRFRKDQVVARLEGRVRAILQVERTAMNFLGRLSGISTRTRFFVDQVRPYGTAILGTRKTTPLWRDTEKYAIRVGGGRNHRMGLWDRIFVKENHRPYGDLRKLLRHPGRFHIEVRNLRELSEALMLEPGVILFDNFSARQLEKAVKIARKSQPKILLEASGGIQTDNVSQYAATGVDWISIGSLTHSVRSSNFSLLIEEPKRKGQ